MTTLTPPQMDKYIAPENSYYRMEEFVSLNSPDGATFSGDEKNVLFSQNGEGEYIEEAFTYGLDNKADGRGIVCTDLNHDGSEDLILRNLQKPELEIYLVIPSENNWIELDFTGDPDCPNPFNVQAEIITPSRSERKILQGGSAFLSQQPLRLHFGLADRKKVSVKIYWPDNSVQILANLEANNIYKVRKKSTKVIKVETTKKSVPAHFCKAEKFPYSQALFINEFKLLRKNPLYAKFFKAPLHKSTILIDRNRHFYGIAQSGNSFEIKIPTLEYIFKELNLKENHLYFFDLQKGYSGRKMLPLKKPLLQRLLKLNHG
ncbi:ASPIC/UnbV domain-containing protein [Candidatus Riflebacteria bacterium]